MNPQEPQFYLSGIDEERFGIRTARASGVTQASLPSLLNFCRVNEVVLLIARCPTSDLEAAQAMEQEGFLLMDTLVYYARDLQKKPVPDETGRVPVRPLRPGEEKVVGHIAAESFKGYLGHYHVDRRLDRAKCDETYISWAVRCCLHREVAHQVVLAEQGGEALGFAALRLNQPEEGEAFLIGVLPPAQGQGIYRSFILYGMKWCLSFGAKRMVESTQVTNLAVQKVWIRLGFEPSHSYYTFHKWFDES